MIPIASTALRIAFFGDSICVGQGVSIYRGWVTRVAGRLDEVAAECGQEIVVINSSVNGSTTRQALERMPYDIQSHRVDILIIQFGLNDCNYWHSDAGLPRVSAAAYAANLQEIIERGVRFGAKIIFLHNNHPTTRTDEVFPNSSVTFEESNRRYNSIVRDVARRLQPQVTFTDIEAAFDYFTKRQRDLLATLLLPDGLHLSVAGHNLYFDTACDKIVRAAKALLANDT